MEQAVNSFSKGLQLDTHPIVLSSEAVSDALNATFLTMNGNEMILLNDMGNRKVDLAFLPTGYVPVGMKEHGGIIYVASYNPITNMSLIGSFPSPQTKFKNEDGLNSTIDFDSFIQKEENNYIIKSDTILKILTKNKLMHVGDKFYLYSSTIDNIIPYIEKRLFNFQIGVLNSSNEFIDISENLNGYDIEYPSDIGEYIKYEEGIEIVENIINNADTIDHGNTSYDSLELLNNNSGYFKCEFCSFEKFDPATYESTLALYVGFNVDEKIYYESLDTNTYVNIINPSSSILELYLYVKVPGNDYVMISYDIEGMIAYQDSPNVRGEFKSKIAIPSSSILKYLKLPNKFPVSNISKNISNLSENDKLFKTTRLSLDMNTYSYKLVSPLYAKVNINYYKQAYYSFYKTTEPGENNSTNNFLIIKGRYKSLVENEKFPVLFIIDGVKNILESTDYLNYIDTNGSIISNVTYKYLLNKKSNEYQITITPLLEHFGFYNSKNILLKEFLYSTTLNFLEVSNGFDFLGWRYYNDLANNKTTIYLKYRINPTMVKKILLDVNNTRYTIRDILSTDDSIHNTEGDYTIRLNLENKLYKAGIYILDNNDLYVKIVENLNFLYTLLFNGNYNNSSQTIFTGNTYDYDFDKDKFIENYLNITEVLVTPNLQADSGLYWDTIATQENLKTFDSNSNGLEEYVENITLLTREYHIYPKFNINSSLYSNISIKNLKINSFESLNPNGKADLEYIGDTPASELFEYKIISNAINRGRLEVNINYTRRDRIVGTVYLKTTNINNFIVSLSDALNLSRVFTRDNMDYYNPKNMAFWQNPHWSWKCAPLGEDYSSNIKNSNTVNDAAYNLNTEFSQSCLFSDTAVQKNIKDNFGGKLFVIEFDDKDYIYYPDVVLTKVGDYYKPTSNVGPIKIPNRYKIKSTSIPWNIYHIAKSYYRIWMRLLIYKGEQHEITYVPILIYPGAWEQNEENFIKDDNIYGFNKVVEDIKSYCLDINRFGCFYTQWNYLYSLYNYVINSDEALLHITKENYTPTIKHDFNISISGNFNDSFFKLKENISYSFNNSRVLGKTSNLRSYINSLDANDSNNMALYAKVLNGQLVVQSLKVYNPSKIYAKNSSGELVEYCDSNYITNETVSNIRLLNISKGGYLSNTNTKDIYKGTRVYSALFDLSYDTYYMDESKSDIRYNHTYRLYNLYNSNQNTEQRRFLFDYFPDLINY